MEVVLGMKLTDMAIVFQLFLICLMTVLHIKSSYIHAEVTNEIMYNNVMDGIVEDALRAGYKTIDNKGMPVVDLAEVRRCFVAERNIYDTEDKHILIYVSCNGFYVWDSELSWEWSNIIEFEDAENTSHEQMINQLTVYLKLNYKVDISLPYNDGENIMNTVEEYTLFDIALNRNSTVKSFSAAKIHKVN